MKKLLSLFIAVILLFSSASVFAQKNITILLDGESLETPIAPVIQNGSTMVPFRVIFEALGMRVEWSEALEMVYAMNGEKTIILTIGSNKMRVQTEVVDIPVAPYISNGHTLVPVRAVCDAMDCSVDWNEQNREVIIKTAGYVEPTYNPVIDSAPAYINKAETDNSTKIVELINGERASYGLDPLIIDEVVADVALSHSADMAINDYIDHESPQGMTLFDRLDNAGIEYNSAAENIGSGFIKAEDVVESWMNSPAHKEIILGTEFSHIGVGYYAGGSNGTYWTLVLVGK